jgi:hypothetical protein
MYQPFLFNPNQGATSRGSRPALALQRVLPEHAKTTPLVVNTYGKESEIYEISLRL